MTSREKIFHPRIAILASGRGSNLEALARAVQAGSVPGCIVCVLSDVPNAPALERARHLGLPAEFLDPGRPGARLSPDAEMQWRDHLTALRVDLVCLAGFFRILGQPFLEAFPGRVLNVHPSLLPAYPGLHAVRQALEAGARVSGATVHLVTPLVDAGPILIQEAVAVVEGDDEESLGRRIQEVEHRIYPQALALVTRGVAPPHGPAQTGSIS